jgi:proteasome lid subunit RPN8/RPN11
VITEAAADAYPLETGGVLVGVMAEDRPWVLAAIRVPNASGTQNSFLLPKGARPRLVAEYRKIEPKAGYLGDWHTHPANSGPSKIDSQSLNLLANGKGKPLLILAILVEGEFHLRGYQIAKDGLQELRLELSGQLGSE